MRHIYLIFTLVSLLTCYASAEEPAPTATAPAPTTEPGPELKRDPASSSDSMDPVYFDDRGGSRGRRAGMRKHRSESTDFGLMVQPYYDPVSSYLKMVSSTFPTGFGSTSATGMFGMQILATYLNSYNFELAAGIDYIFPLSLQGQQAFNGQYAVNSQTLNIMGVRVAQIGYPMVFGNFTLVPYGAVGVYYGKDVVQLTTNLSQVDTLTYTKLSATFTAGLRGEFALNDSFAMGLGLEVFEPVNLATQISQSGSAIAESPIAGYESTLQSQMEFMNSVGFRILAHLRAVF